MTKPARPRRPRDKAKVEAYVGIIERWLLARLRNRTFYSLAELNGAIAEWLAKLNNGRVLRQYGRTRGQLFEEIDAPNLKPLPGEPWVHAEWRRCRVGLDYHVEIERHYYYSVPYRFAPREVEASRGASVSPRTCTAAATGGTRRSAPTCLPAIGAMASGRRQRSLRP